MEKNNGKGEDNRRVIAEINAYQSKYDNRIDDRTVRPTSYQQPEVPKKKKKKGLSFGAALIIDAVAIAAFLLIFAYLHHVNPIFTKIDEPLTLPAPMQTEQPEVSEEAVPEEQPVILPAETVTEEQTEEIPAEEPVPEEPVEPQHKFEDKFSDEVVHTDNQYINKNVNVTVTTTEEDGVIYHVADVYVRDVQYLKTAFGSDKGFGMTKNHRSTIKKVSQRVNAFVAINGDQCGQHHDGMVVRNGELYRQSEKDDVCVLNYDGTLVTYAEDEFDTEATIEAGAWQVWTFGPELLDDNGQPLEDFNTTVEEPNPRSAIGMIEPLHYVLVTVDGRGESEGLDMWELAELMQKLGCTAAYNLDGGGTAAMTVNGELYSTPSKTRSVFDVIYIEVEE